MAFPLNSRLNQTANSCKKRKQPTVPRLANQYCLSTLLCLNDHCAKFVPDIKTGLKTHKITIWNTEHQITMLQDWLYVPDFFCRWVMKTFTKNPHQNLYCISSAKNWQLSVQCWGAWAGALEPSIFSRAFLNISCGAGATKYLSAPVLSIANFNNSD